MEPRIHGPTKRRREQSNDSPFSFTGSKILRLGSPELSLTSPDSVDSVSSDVKSVDSKRIAGDSGFDVFQEDLLEIVLDEGDGAMDRDLDSVIRSFENEIQAPAVQPELGYLLQASDDELGLPPAGENGGAEDIDFGDKFSGILGFEDEVDSNYCWLENLSSENESNEGEEDQGVALGGLFDDFTAGTAELPPYRSETMMY